MKRKPLRNCENDPLVLKKGRQKKAYTVEDAARMVSLIVQAASEVDMVSRDLHKTFPGSHQKLFFCATHNVYS